MHLLDLPQELFSYIVHFVDPNTLRALCLTEKRMLYNITRYFLWRNMTFVFSINRNPIPNIVSCDSGRLATVRSLYVIVDVYFDLSPSIHLGLGVNDQYKSRLCEWCIRPLHTLDSREYDGVSRDTKTGSLRCGATRLC